MRPKDVLYYSGCHLRRTRVDDRLLIFVLCLCYFFPQLMFFLFMGVCSSISLGTGLPLGVFYMWPQVVTDSVRAPTTFAAICCVAPRVLSYYLGSSLGELPPFYMAKTLVKDSPHEEMIRWAVHKVHDYRVMFIVGMSAWPSVLVDIAGVAAGLANMAMPEFLGGVIFGKVCLRAPILLALAIGSSRNFIDYDFVQQVDQSYVAIIAQYAVIFMSMYMSWRFLVKIAISEKRRQQNILDCTKKTRQ